MGGGRWPALLLLATVAAACALPQASPRLVAVTVYGRNATPLTAWFGTYPVTDPLSTVGFGPDGGYACWSVPAGSRFGLLDGSPSDTRPAMMVRELAIVDPSGPRSAVLWVDVAGDRSVTSGSGVPAWWPDPPAAC